MLKILSLNFLLSLGGIYRDYARAEIVLNSDDKPPNSA